MKTVWNLNLRDFADKGDKIYEQIKNKLEKTHKGDIVAIEVESGDYVIGSDLVDAGNRAKEKYPNKIFHFIKIGYPAVFVHR
ncbi:MAG TPA: hypothetical protein EYP22_04720 [Methanosarcinales archaeon]|nr:hypothetical protein [Methanosarcinales archaeon]